MYINEFLENDEIIEQLLVVNISKGASNTGAPYLTVTFQDKSGTIDGKIWSATPYDIETFAIGNVVRIHASAILYKEKIQLKVIDGEKVDPSKVDINKFALESPVPQKVLEEKLKSFVDSIKQEEYHKVVNEIVNEYYDKLVIAPAAVRNHHEHLNGLLLHSISMAEMAESICKHYPDVDRDLLISGCILHDIGKTIELSGPIAAKYTLEGRLIGHISTMHAIVREKCLSLKISDERRILLEHMILSHHGVYEFGSPVLPETRESLLLNMIDDMDAKMNTLNKYLKETKEGEWTSKIFPLDDRAFYNHKK